MPLLPRMIVVACGLGGGMPLHSGVVWYDGCK